MTAEKGSWVFAYGSLMHPPSAYLSVGRTIRPLPATLKGWQRTWNAVTDNSISNTYRCPSCLGVIDKHVAVTNMIPNPDGSIPGACFWVSPEEMAFLTEREQRYNCLEISASNFIFDQELPIAKTLFAWERKIEFCYQQGQCPVIPSDYISSCLHGMQVTWGQAGGQLFAQSTITPEGSL